MIALFYPDQDAPGSYRCKSDTIMNVCTAESFTTRCDIMAKTKTLENFEISAMPVINVYILSCVVVVVVLSLSASKPFNSLIFP